MKADCQGRYGDQHPSWEGATKVWCPRVGRDKTIKDSSDRSRSRNMMFQALFSQANVTYDCFSSFGPELEEVDCDWTDDLGHLLPW